MTLKGEVIESLIELSKHRRWAKQYASNAASRIADTKTATAIREYAREVDNGFALVVKAINALIKRRPPRRLGLAVARLRRKS